MSIKTLLELSIESINKYNILVNNNTNKKKYSSELVSAYNNVGDNLEALSEEITYIFSNDSRYEEHFENDEIQDYISESLNNAFNEYSVLLKQNSCDEKVILAYEWLFEIMLFTTDDEELKSKITLNKNSISLISNPEPLESIPVNSKIVQIKLKSGKDIDEIFLQIEEIIDDYIYCYLGDNQNENDLIIFHTSYVYKTK